MNTDKERHEASMPIQARINICSLAKVDRYLLGIGINANNRSRLVNYAIEMLANSISKHSISLEEAYRHFEGRNMPFRNKKMSISLAVQDARAEGESISVPKLYINMPEQITLPTTEPTLPKQNNIQIIDGEEHYIDSEGNDLGVLSPVGEIVKSIEEVDTKNSEEESRRMLEVAKSLSNINTEYEEEQNTLIRNFTEYYNSKKFNMCEMLGIEKPIPQQLTKIEVYREDERRKFISNLKLLVRKADYERPLSEVQCEIGEKLGALLTNVRQAWCDRLISDGIKIV